MEYIDKNIKVNLFLKQSTNYLKNARELLKKNKLNKSGEVLWGAISSLIKAIGIIYNVPTRTHRKLINLAKQIALNKNDNEIRFGIIRDAKELHANFYQNFLEPDDLKEKWFSCVKVYNKLFQIIMEKSL